MTNYLKTQIHTSLEIVVNIKNTSKSLNDNN